MIPSRQSLVDKADEIVQILESDYFKLFLEHGHYWNYLESRVQEYKELRRFQASEVCSLD